jgi:hypothetical protein
LGDFGRVATEIAQDPPGKALPAGLTTTRSQAFVMSPGAPHTPPRVVALVVVVVAVGVCMMAAATMVPTMLGRLGAWPVFGIGFVALVGALAALWVIQKKRDRTSR